jgi:hypothetical protein
MSWVRYDDGFPGHPKTVEVKAACIEALALHLLCNTWTATTSTPGLVPLAAVIDQAGKTKGPRWARALAAAGMWHTAGHDCDRCPQPAADGYVIHDYPDYNPIGETSRKRSEAGRKGAAARWQGKGKPPDPGSNGMASAIDQPSPSHANVMAKNGIARGHPVPQVPSAQLGSYVATVDAHESAPELADVQPEHSDAGWLAAYFAERQPLTDHGRALRVIGEALAANYTPDQVRNGLDRLADQRRGCSRDQLRIAIVEADGNWRPAGSQPAGNPYLNLIRDGAFDNVVELPQLEAGAS